MSTEDTESSTGGNEDFSEPKEKPKIIRVLTVVAYTLSVSMAAILLSVYYVFMWDGHPTLARKGPVSSPMRAEDYETLQINHTVLQRETAVERKPEPGGDMFFGGTLRFGRARRIEEEKTKDKLEPYPYEPTAIPVMEAFTTQPPEASTETTLDEDEDGWQEIHAQNFTEKLAKMSKRSILFQKLIHANLG